MVKSIGFMVFVGFCCLAWMLVVMAGEQLVVLKVGGLS